MAATRKKTILFSLCAVLALAAALALLGLGLAHKLAVPFRPPRPTQPAVEFGPAQLDGKRAMKQVCDFVAVGPRISGSDGAERAAGFIAERLKKIGIDPLIDQFEDAGPHGRTVFRNVLGVIEGTEDAMIVLASHYDTKGGIAEDFAGANDSGSSTGLLLELARVLRRDTRRGFDILLAFLDGEECVKGYGKSDGLHGSKHLAKTLVRNRRSARVRAVIVLDMIGDRDFTVTIPRNSSPELVSLVFDAARAESARLHFSFADGVIIDDHVPFLSAGMPAVDIIDFEFGSAPGRNDYWHTPEDTLDKLSPGSLETAGRVVIRVVNALQNKTGVVPPDVQGIE